MKLFVTNKHRVEEIFGLELSNTIHKRAYTMLSVALADNNIPMMLLPEYKDGGLAIFDFKFFKGDVFFYEFATSVS